MLKSVMYFFMLFTTALRLVDTVYLLLQDTVTLPVQIFIACAAMVIWGAFLLARRFFASVLLRPMMVFYIVQIAVILFNITWVARTSPLVPTWPEVLLIGSFLEVLIDAAIVYKALQQTRRRTMITVGHIS